MTVRELKMKHKRARANKRKEVITNIVLGTVVVVGMVIFGNMFINTWVEEIDNHGEYNRNYIQQMEEVKAGK